MCFTEIIPISAKFNTQIEILTNKIFSNLSENPHYFPVKYITDKDIRFRLAEIVREKLTRLLNKELPYALTVHIEHMSKEGNQTVVHAIILVEKENQKQITIGSNGEILKKIGTQARKDMNRLLDCRVHLLLWVKTKAGWSNNKKTLQNLGYMDLFK